MGVLDVCFRCGHNANEKIAPSKLQHELINAIYRTQAQQLTQCPMAILTKAAPVLNVEHFIDIMPVAWELMLESDQELAAAAASVFLLSSAKSSDKARNMIIKELQHEETSQRINAVLRFGALWKFRYQVWPRMEDGANLLFKVSLISVMTRYESILSFDSIPLRPYKAESLHLYGIIKATSTL